MEQRSLSGGSKLIEQTLSVNSKPEHPPGDPRGFAHSHCPGGQVFAKLSLPGGRGFESEKFPTALKEK